VAFPSEWNNIFFKRFLDKHLEGSQGSKSKFVHLHSANWQRYLEKKGFLPTLPFPFQGQTGQNLGLVFMMIYR